MFQVSQSLGEQQTSLACFEKSSVNKLIELLLAAFHQSCCVSDLESAHLLLDLTEQALMKASCLLDRRHACQQLVDAHKLLWHFQRYQQIA